MGMTTIRWILAFSLLFCAAPPLRAEESKASSALSWFKNWKNALQRSAVEGKYRRMRTATAVAAVRGAGQAGKDPDAAYWKGGWSEKRVAERMKEREELSAAVGLIFDEKPAEARAALDAFEKAHPKSSFLDEVADARTKLDELEGKAPAEEPAKTAPQEAPKTEAPKAEAPAPAPAAP